MSTWSPRFSTKLNRVKLCLSGLNLFCCGERDDDDMLRFAMRDIAFNLVPENVFTAPFQRFQTLQVVPPGNELGMDAMESGDQETQLVGNLAEEVANVQRSPAEAHFEGKVVDGANVLGLVAAAAALGAAAAIRKEEGKMVVEVSGGNVFIRST